MRQIDLETWPRRAQYEFLRDFDYPHFNLCANVDITTFQSTVKQGGNSFTMAVVYVLARAANEIPEFRTRIRGDIVVEHDVVHPSTTYLTEGDLFSFCHMTYDEDYSHFARRAAQQIALIQDHPTLEDEPGKDDLLFLTSIPWVSFTGLVHPINMSPVDSVPRIAWGKFFSEGGRMKMPLCVQAHHALMDGVHLGRYYELVQNTLNHPGFLLDQP